MQELTLSDGRPVWQQVAELVAEWGRDLVGDRASRASARCRRHRPPRRRHGQAALPRSVLLLPGVGAQAQGPPTWRAPSRAARPAHLVTASRSVIYAYRGGSEEWRSAAAAEAARLRSDVWSVSGW